MGLFCLIGLCGVTAWNLTRSDALAKAQQAYAQNKLDLALQRALDHLTRQPWSKEAALVAARCLSRLDYAESAEEYYARAGDLNLDDLQIRAYGLVRGNFRQQAIEAYEQILEQWPNDLTALRCLAAVQITENNTPQLEGLAKRLIETPGGASLGYTLSGVVNHQERNYEAASNALTSVLEVDPELRSMPLPHHFFWTVLSVNLIKSGRLDEARAHLAKVLNETPDANLMNTLGQAYQLQGLLDDAEGCFRQAVEWDPRIYLSYFNLAKIALQRRRLDEAMTYLEKANALRPGQPEVLISMVSTLRLLHRPEEADRIDAAFRQAISRPVHDPKEPWPHYAL